MGTDSRDNQDLGDAPWASKSSVYALLNSDVPTKRQQPATEEEEDPLAAIKAHKKHKKEVMTTPIISLKRQEETKRVCFLLQFSAAWFAILHKLHCEVSTLS